MRIAVTGASGLVGGALLDRLRASGHTFIRLVRRSPAGPDEVRWDPDGGVLDPGRLAACDAVVHLAGEAVSTGRWTARKKERIRKSRVAGSALLASAIASLERRPRVLVSASAIGIYGDRGDEQLDESSPPGEGFRARVCREWEDATRPATEAGIRVVHARFGIVLSPRGGALRAMLPAFRLGLGGPFGDGCQFMSWVALEDAVGAIEHLITAPVEGPVNVVVPEPVTNREFARALGAALQRPAFLRVPRIVLRGLLGELADEALLSSQRVLPRRLMESGMMFRYPELRGAMAQWFGRP